MTSELEAEVIIAGAGLAGCTVLRHLLSNPTTAEKDYLFLDRDHAINNDKTWCFWSEEDSFTESVVAHRWKKIMIGGAKTQRTYDLERHQYKCIRSQDYLRAARASINPHPNVRCVTGDVLDFGTDGPQCTVTTRESTLRSTLVLQSVLKPEPVAKQRTPIRLLQHFLGWEIQAELDVFDPDVATFMDFRTDQSHGFAFVYVLPFTARHALVEYTLFSPSTLGLPEYEQALRGYLTEVIGLSPTAWNLTRTEYGVLPMEDVRYPAWYDKGILNMGLNGGQCKPSTGYTFTRVQRYALEVAKSIAKRSMQDLHQQSPVRFMIYDRLILWLLRERPAVVPEIFIDLFEKNGADRMFEFLNEDTHFGQELQIMASTRWRYFFLAIWKSMITR